LRPIPPWRTLEKGKEERHSSVPWPSRGGGRGERDGTRAVWVVGEERKKRGGGSTSIGKKEKRGKKPCATEKTISRSGGTGGKGSGEALYLFRKRTGQGGVGKKRRLGGRRLEQKKGGHDTGSPGGQLKPVLSKDEKRGTHDLVTGAKRGKPTDSWVN